MAKRDWCVTCPDCGHRFAIAPGGALTRLGPIAIDGNGLRVWVNGQRRPLWPNAVKILLRMVQAPGVVFSRDNLMAIIDSWDVNPLNLSRQYIYRIRRAVEDVARVEPYRGRGWALELREDADERAS